MATDHTDHTDLELPTPAPEARTASPVELETTGSEQTRAGAREKLEDDLSSDESDLDQQGDAAPEVDRSGYWEASGGDKPDPAEISAQADRAHILYGDGDGQGGGHRYDSGIPEKNVFPPGWDDNKIIDNVEDVARSPDEQPTYDEDEQTWTARGTRNSVDIEANVTPDGRAKTGYPTGGEGVHRNDEHGVPYPLDR